MRRITANAIALAVAVAAGSVCFAEGTEHKQFRWKDAAGEVHYADTLTADALKAGYDVISDKGFVLRHIDRARTDEERKADDAAAKAAAEAKREADERAEADRRMLAAFPTEAELVNMRQGQIDGIAQAIVAATNSLNSQEQALSENLAHAAALERANKKVPDSLQKQIENLRKSAESLRRHIQRRQQEKIEATKKLETDVVHYREARERNNS